jgi:poly(3-hydroxybutyrate) depolymerase
MALRRARHLSPLLLVLACARSSPHQPATGGGGGEPPEETGGSGGTATGGATGGDAAPAPKDARPSEEAGTPPAVDAAAPDAAPSAGRSAGCGSNNPGGMFMIPAGAGQQPYLVVLPKSYDGSKAYPLVFYLHGRGNSLTDRPRNLETALAAADKAIVLYAKSITSGWEVEGRDQPAEHTKMLRALRQRAFEQYCVDTGKVVMTGFSSGGNFVGYLQCTMATEINAAVIAGGSTHATCTGKLPALVIIGRADPSFMAAERSAEYLRARNGCAMTRKPGAVNPCEDYEGCPAGGATGFCPFDGGHMWPAFAASAVADLLARP